MIFVTLDTVKRGDWHIKASVFDEQILIFFTNKYTIPVVKIFYNEDEAYYFIESLVND